MFFLKTVLSIIAFVTSLFSSELLAAEVAIDIQATMNSIDIQESKDNEKTIARMTSDIKYYPTVSLLSHEYYFSKDSSVGVQLQFGWSIFKVDKQEVGGNDTGIGLGTSISGYALSGVLVLFGTTVMNGCKVRHRVGTWAFKAQGGLPDHRCDTSRLQ